MTDADPYTIELWYKLEHDKQFIVAGYNPTNQKITIFHGDGPHNWTLIFLRTFYNKIEWYQSRNSFSETSAEIEMDQIFEALKNKGKLRLEKILKESDWEKRTRTNLSTKEFNAVLKGLVESTEVYD